MRNQILFIHANAGIGNRKGLVFIVQLQVNPRTEWEGLVSLIDKRQVAELIERIGGVGDEFPEENLRMRIEGVDDQLK